MEKKQVNINVSLNGEVMASCAGLDVALITLDGIMNKIGKNDNFILSIQKQTIIRTEPDKPAEENAVVTDGKKSEPSKEPDKESK